ncbi:MAG: ABC transporter ATP-binding protein [Kiritimatiellae bacterium]|nr:ABC transporter ATP-binding protein [Kiritimatiellia bacterium]
MKTGGDYAIEIDGVTKRFRLSGAGRSLKSAVIDFAMRRRPPEFTALSDVSLKVRRGETVGIVGANGAGKSTLLSIVAGTVWPTCGTVKTHGSVSSLLELGAGFHPDLTGRENVRLYGAIMGMKPAEMRRRFDEIVAFSGLGDFIDQPVRFYSSGMYVRLGFSVAVQVDPDILLVDEVLAVGDADFQRRCLAKMDEFRASGKTLLLISHDIETVRRVSDRIAYLSHGRLESFGDPASVADAYLASSTAANPAMPGAREWGEPGTVRFVRISFVDPGTGEEKGGPVCPATSKPVFRLRWKAEKRIENPVVGFSLDDAASGCRVFGSNTQICGRELPAMEGEGSIDLAIDTSDLQAGDYSLSFALHSADHATNYHRVEHGFALHVRERKWFDGVVRLPVEWS